MTSKFFLSETLAPLNLKRYLYLYPHNALPSHNLHQDVFSSFPEHEDVSVPLACEIFQEFPYACSFPVPPLPPTKVPKDVLNGIDPGVSLVYAKAEWEHKKKSLIKHCRYKSKKQMPSVESIKTSKYMDIPAGLASLAFHMQADPDKSFNGSYNWYYTGGILDILPVEDNMYLVKPNGYDDNTVLITLLDTTNDSLVVSDKAFLLPLNSQQPFHQITCNKQGFLVRQYDQCTFFRASGGEVDDLSVEYGSSVTSEDPFIHCSLYKNSMEFCTLSTARDLSFWEVESRKPFFMVDMKEDSPLLDNWGCSYYSDSNTVLYMDRGTVKLIDKRAPQNSNGSKWFIGNVCEDCEYIHAGAKGSKGLHYVSTSHQLLGLDLRQGFVQRWTHGITHSPSLLKVFRHQDLVDSVFIGSQRGDTLVFVQNSWETGEMGLSRVEPYILPSLTESLQQARCQGQCLNPLLNSRFSMSMTGLCCLGDKKHLNVIRCTSVGDVFVQSLKRSSKRGMADTICQEDLSKLSHFEELCCGEFKDSINLNYMTDVKCVDHLIDVGRNEMSKVRESHWATEDDKKEEWRISKRRLTSFCDYLAPKLLKSWGLDDLEEWSPGSPVATDEESSLTEDEKEDVTEKVFSWILKHNPGNALLGDDSAGSSHEADGSAASNMNVDDELLMSTDDTD